MKKWQRMTLTFGLASSLLVPSFSSAAVKTDWNGLKVKAEADMMKKFNQSRSEQRLLSYQKQQEKQEVLSSDTIIVKYENKLSATVHRKSGARLERSIPSLGYDVVKLAKGQKVSDVLAFYSRQPGVLSATPSVTYQSFATKSDPKKSQMYHLSLLNIDKALSLAGDNAVTVAVIDTGMDVKHPELKSQVLPPYSVLNPANQPFSDVHATHVAGIIAAEQNNSIGGHGINPKAKILPIDVFGGGWGTSDYVIAEGILYAISKNVDVINMSLGGSQESPILEEAVKKAVEAGITIVAAAGNNYGESISYPAAYDGVIAVSATNDKNELAEFSSYGAFVDIAAPGEAIYNSLFDYRKGSSFGYLSGTSMASPVVAGVASLILSKYPDLKPFEVEAILKMTAKDLGDKGYDVKYGAGFVDAVSALQFNIENLPRLVAETEADAKAKAQELTTDQSEWKNKILTPGETHWYKVKLAQGEGAQALLDGAKQFNYQMMFDFVPDNAEGEKIARTVNEAPNGKQEGGFFHAKEAGTLYVGVKDVYGHYDSTSEYTLSLKKETTMNIDSVSPQEPVVIETLPFNSADASTLTFAVEPEAKEGDKDYFRFTVTEPTMVKFDLSAVPGINSSMAVYFEEEFLMEPPKDLPPGYIWQPGIIQYANNNGISEGEKLSFEAMPGMNYFIEVSAEPRRDFWFDMFFGAQPEKKFVPNSNTPYTLKAEKVDLGKDEDGFPVREQRPEEAVSKEEMTKEEYKAVKQKEFQSAMEQLADFSPYRYFPQEMMEIVKAQAVPYQLGEQLEGMIHFGGDEDYYKFTADTDAIYQFELGMPKELLPWVLIMEYDAKTNDLLPVDGIWTYSMLWGQKPDLTRAIALEKGKEYYIRVMNERFQPSEESYTLTTTKLMDVPVMNDKDENQDFRAKTLLPGDTDTNEFIYRTDTDFYYYKNRENDKHFSLTVQPQPFTEEEMKSYPEELLNPLIAFVNIVEDTNGNLKIDEDEFGKAMGFYPNFYGTSFNVEASFKAKKDVGYFFVLNGFAYDGGITVQPYKIGLHNWNTFDEDKGSVLKGNVPSKPIPLKKKDNIYTASGFFNPGIDFGDKDYYSLKVDRYSKFEVSLEMPTGLDGSITIFDAKGKKVGRYDHYGSGDNEIATVVLPKGQYYILIEDALGNTSLAPYKLNIKK